MEFNPTNPNCPKLPWMVEFFSSEDGTILNGQLGAAFAKTTLEFLSALNVKSKASDFRSTQLVCSIPLQATCNTIEELMALGMSVARITCPGNNKDKILELITKIRTLNDQYSRKIGRIYPLAFALDVKGPEIHIGTLEKNKPSLFLAKGKMVTLTTDDAYEEYVNEDMIFVDYGKLADIVQPGDQILLDYGASRLSAIEAAESFVRCVVDKAGSIISRASVTIPNAPIDLPSIGDEDKEIIEFALDNHLDLLIVSGICNKENINDLKRIFGSALDKIQLIVRIENSLAVDNVDDIIENSDGICIDCERLLLEIPKEKVFLAQKCILAKCALKGVPAICTTNIQDTVSLSKAEVCDIANAIIDGIDALMIPQAACTKAIVKDVSVVCKEAEPAVYQTQIFNELVQSIPTPNEAVYALCISAVEASLKSSSAAIICLTTSGRTAKIISRFRPRCPVITITRYARVARLLRLYKGIEPIIYLKPFGGNMREDVEERVQLGVTYGKHMGYIKMGDAVVTVTGTKPELGMPNRMQVVYASDYDTLVKKTKFSAYKNVEIV